MRLGDASMADLEQAGQRFYEAKGLRAGEDAEPFYIDAPDHEAYLDLEPDDTLQPWEVDPHDEIVADPSERDS